MNFNIPTILFFLILFATGCDGLAANQKNKVPSNLQQQQAVTNQALSGSTAGNTRKGSGKYDNAHTARNLNSETNIQAQKAPLSFGEGPITVEAISQYNTLLTGKKSELNLILRITASEEIGVQKRSPLDLAVIIDRSGSMSGGKLAAVKVAALELFKKLSPNDKVTLISYDHQVRVLTDGLKANTHGKRQLKNAVLSLSPGGSTALGPATLIGIDKLKGHKKSKENMLHIMLLSDGLANTGIQNPKAIGLHVSNAFVDGISLSTLGVGLDYNEDLMTHMADQGGGNYHFIEDEKKIAGVLADEFKGLVATSARETYLTFKAAEGFEFLHAFGYPAKHQNGETQIKVGAMRAGQQRDIVIRLAQEALKPGPATVGEFKISYKNMLQNGTRMAAAGTLTLNTTDAKPVFEASENTEVTVLLAEVQSSDKLEIAAKEVAQGNFQQAETVLDQSIFKLEKQALQTPSPKLRRQINVMKKAKTDIEIAKTSESHKKAYVKSKKSKAYKSKKKSRKKGMDWD